MPLIPSASEAGQARPWLALFFLLLLFRLPFLLTGHIQDDAFISLRCARQLAETGIYGFNPGERSSASTAHLYVFMSAGLYKLFGERFMAPLLWLNSCLLLAGLGLAAQRIFPDLRSRLLLWAMAALLPASVLSGTLGMETALLLFLLGAAFKNGADPSPRAQGLAAAALFFLPWTRPDAVAAGLILLLLPWLRRRRLPRLQALGLALGAATLLLFNHFYFGAWLNQTIIGKNICYQPSRDLASIWKNLGAVFLGEGFDMGVYSPLKSRYLMPLRHLVLGAALAIFATALRRPQLLPLVLLALLLPAFYAFGGILFPWYFYPWNICAWLVIFSVLLQWLQSGPARLQKTALALLFLALIASAGFQWLVSVKEGASTRCLAGMGREIKGLAGPQDSLFLEPAGTIPYYAGLRTLDEVGLVSPLANRYQKKNKSGWYNDFVSEQRPTFIMLAKGKGIQTCGNLDQPSRQAWLRRHYRVVREFRCVPGDFESFKVPWMKRGEVAYELLRLNP